MPFRKYITTFGNKDLESKWQELQRRIAEGFGPSGDIVWEYVFFVGTDGDDDTALPSSFVYKYRTIQAAVQAASLAVGTALVLVGPGTYNESVLVVPNVHAFDVAIVGMGKEQVTIAAPAQGQPAVTYVAQDGDELPGLLIKGVTIEANLVGPAVHVNGTNEPATTFDGSGLRLDDVIVTNAGDATGAMTLICVNKFEVLRCTFNQQVNVRESNGGFGSECHFNLALAVTWNMDDVQPGAGRDWVYVRNSVLDTFILNEQGQAEIDNCTIERWVDCNFTPDNGDTADGRLLVKHSRVLDGFEVGLFHTAVEPVTVCEIYNSYLLGDITLEQTGGGGQPQLIARACDGIGVAWSSGGDCNIDLRGSTFLQPSLANDGGTYDRDTHVMEGAVFGNVPTAVDIVPPFPSSEYWPYVSDTINIQEGVLVSVKSGTQVTGTGWNVAGAVQVTCNMVLVRQEI